MRKLEVGVKYKTLDGKTFSPIVLQRYEGYLEAHCDDSWWRFAEGPNAGLFVGAQEDPGYRHHTDWPKIEGVQVPAHQQLDLF